MPVLKTVKFLFSTPAVIAAFFLTLVLVYYGSTDSAELITRINVKQLTEQQFDIELVPSNAPDKKRGGYYHSNFDYSPRAPVACSKQWWVQAECIHALVELSCFRPEKH